jgi:hypothetical protein
MTQRITKIEFGGFDPIADGQVMEFPEKPANSKKAEVQLFTGENGTGKTRILSLLAAGCGDSYELEQRFGKQLTPIDGAFVQQNWRNVARSKSTTVFGILVKLMPVKQTKLGIAFRTSTSLAEHAVRPLESRQHDSNFFLRFEKDYNCDLITSQRMVNILIKAGIAAKSHDTEVRSYRVLSVLEKTVSAITNKRFSFTLRESINDTVVLNVNWAGKLMSFAQVPDGLRAIFKLIASLAMILDERVTDQDKDIFQEPFTLILDEPETHLHPKWQRLLLPTVQDLFPNAQIFCATHSPFVISSVNEGFIHILRFNDAGQVIIDPAKACGQADTYQDVVADVLGLDALMDYDPETEKLLKAFEEKRKLVRTQSAFEDLKLDAEAIAKRSRRLNYLMGQQIHQLRVQLERKASETVTNA